MEKEQLSNIDLLIETHIGLDRQGPGSPGMTLRALSFIDNLNEHPRVADLGCGTGGQTMLLAQNLPGTVVGLDLFSEFINAFNDRAEKMNLSDRVRGVAGSMDDLPFQKEEFDLIWSEGAIDNIGFEKGLRHFRDFLKNGGYVSVSCPSWLTGEHIPEVEKFWTDAGIGLKTAGQNISIMQKAGYSFVAAFALTDECWIDNYFIPREEKEKELLKKYPGNKIAEDSAKASKYEYGLYNKYKRHYGYVFYIGKKIHSR